MSLRALFAMALWTLLAATGAGVARAQDPLLQPRPGEALLGPFPYPQTVLDVPLALRVSYFVSREPSASPAGFHVRVVVDLADLQRHIPVLAGKIPLPKDGCGLDVSLSQESLTSPGGELATLQLAGDAALWACLPLPFTSSSAKTEIVQPVTVALPLRLGLAGPQAIAVTPEKPAVQLGGASGPLTQKALGFFHVDLADRLDALIHTSVSPSLLSWHLPDVLLKAGPVLQRAEFLTNAGTMAASFELTGAPPGVLGGLLQKLQGH